MGLTALRDLELGRAVENGNVQLGTERELDERHRQLAIEIGILAREEIVLGDAHQHVAVAGRSALETARALAADPHLHPVLDPGGAPDLDDMLAPDAAFTPALPGRLARILAP